MNVYDFDETILKGDSEDYFIDFMFGNEERLRSEVRPIVLHVVSDDIDRAQMLKERYAFLKLFTAEEREERLQRFWDIHQHFIKEWYLKQKTPDDVIASATPAFLLWPVIRRLGLKNLLASEFDPETGELNGLYNYRDNKVSRFKKAFPGAEADVFYSDSDSDLPMARIARRAYKVTGDVIEEWKGLER